MDKKIINIEQGTPVHGAIKVDGGDIGPLEPLHHTLEYLIG